MAPHAAVLAALLLTLPMPPQTRPGTPPGARAWSRIPLEGGVSLEVPATWTAASQDPAAAITLREFPSRERIAALVIRSERRTASLRWWRRYHRETTLVETYPGCTIAAEEERRAASFPAVFFHVTRLGGDRSDYDLFETLVPVRQRFVTVSLLFDRGHPDPYRKIYSHVLNSIRGEDTETKPPKGTVRPSPPHTPLPEPAADQIAWSPTLDQAFAEARRRGVPVMIAFNMDHEWANDRIARHHYHDPRIVALSRKMVCVACSVFDHGGRLTLDGARTPCPRFGRISCPEHRDAEIQARETYLRSQRAIAPQHLFCAPDGTILARRQWYLEVSDLAGLMERAVSAVRRRSRARNDAGGALGRLLSAYRLAADPGARHWIVSDALFGGDADLSSAFLDTLARESDAAGLVTLLDAVGFAGHPAGAPAALRALSHPAETVRNHAAVALEEIGAPTAVPRLEAQIPKEPSDRVRKNLLRALGACAVEGDGAASLLLRHARRGSPLVRTNALIALRHFPDAPAVEKGLSEILRGEDHPRVRAAAAWTLGYLDSEKAAPLLEKGLAAPDGDPLETEVLRLALAKIRGTLDWKTDYEEILGRLAGDEIERR